MNIRSLPKNYDRLVLFLSKLKFNFKVIILTETWLSQTNKDDYPLSGYSCSHSVRDTRGGGVSIYYHEEFDCIPLTSLSLVHDFVETNFIQISHSSFIEPLTIGGIYRPPGMKSIDEFHAKIDNILNCKEISGRNIILGGDFNINLLNLHDQKNLNFINLMKSNYFCPLITTPTRVTTNEKNNLKSTLIDHLWYNFNFECSSGVFQTDLSDHYPNFTFFDYFKCSIKPKLITFRDFSHKNKLLFIDKINELNPDRYNDNINKNVNLFLSDLDIAYN